MHRPLRRAGGFSRQIQEHGFHGRFGFEGLAGFDAKGSPSRLPETGGDGVPPEPFGGYHRDALLHPSSPCVAGLGIR
ncbi:hypothetical protein AKJ08_0751 [Vulgatibacter incomptus]|uniref:Uncharacterized protein n=1 Tax=Vulgatibacter incomptus TaxID=1391653 RepID=A0A0K1PB62_9BACT|nr:hypothetical protein AKJ08_0751 [Vulgatibacter incomptus]